MLDDILIPSRDWSQIIAYWDKYIRLQNEDANAYIERSGSYFHQGNLEAARRDAKKAAELGHVAGLSLYQQLQ